MDPITLAILTGTAATAAGQLPQLIPSKFERENKARLEALQRQKKAGTLGLTGQEEALMERQLAGRSQAAAQGAEAERNRLLAGSGGAVAGGALLGAQLGEEERQRAEERISTEIMSQDIQRKRQQEEEIRALQAAEGQRQAEAQAAAGAIVGAGIEAGASTAAQERLFALRKPSEQTVQAYSKILGVSPDEARGYLEFAAVNPEAFKYQDMIMGKRAGGQ